MPRYPRLARSALRSRLGRLAAAVSVLACAGVLLAAGTGHVEAARDRTVKGEKAAPAAKPAPAAAEPERKTAEPAAESPPVPGPESNAPIPDLAPDLAPDGKHLQPRGSRQPAVLESPRGGAAPVPGGLPATPPSAVVPQAGPIGATATPTPRESIDADVSVRSVAVTSAFTGTEVILFGAINNSRPQTSRTDVYDIVVVFEGAPAPVLVRRKSHVAGIWLNTAALKLDRVPSYYAIASTRPLPEIAVPETLRAHRIGFEYVQVDELTGDTKGLDKKQVAEFKQATTQLKRKEGVYSKSDYGVSFIGRSLFRAAIALPANVPVGQLTARVLLFRNGDMLTQTPARVMLARQGIERSLYNFAFDHPLLYGLTAVLIAVASGLLASTLFSRRSA